MGANRWIGPIMGANRTKKPNLTKWYKSKRKKY